MIRRQLVSALLMTLALTVLLGFAYPLAVTGASQLFMSKRADGSLVKVDGQAVGSSLIGQNFTDGDGNALPQYFQPRPSAAGDGYDALSSSGTNLGPSNPKLIGNVPGVNVETNEFASPDDPYCLPVESTDADDNPITDADGNPVYEKNDDGSYVCDSGTVPQRTKAYRELNGLAADAEVPVDAVTASASGLDPQISVQNARLQAARVAEERGIPQPEVEEVIGDHTQGRPLGFLGEQTVNVLELNLALDRSAR